METVIIYNCPNAGRALLCFPTPHCELDIEEIIAKDVPSGLEYVVLEKTQLPKSGIFMAAWFLSDGVLKIDTDDAHALWKKVWRKKREPILKTLDIAFMKAIETGDATRIADITSQKQELRDVTLIELPQPLPEDDIDSFSARIMEVKPACLQW